MGDIYRIDSHKLMYHPERVAQWSNAGNDWEKLKKVYPIYVEISPYGGCNHRCTFCALDYMGYEKIGQEEKALKAALGEMAEGGVRSVMFAGEGEPLLFTPLASVIEHCASIGIDTSITTNFVPCNTKSIETFVRHCSWIKVSLNAGTPESYAAIHQTKEDDFHRVIENLRYAVRLKRDHGYTCTLGAQMLLLPENRDTAVTLAQLCAEIGLDYLVIKPYSQHLFSETHAYEQINYDDYMDLEAELAACNTASFNVVFRANTMRKYTEKQHGYKKCLSTPFFWGYIASNGDVYGCSAYLGQEKFCYGNINETGFKSIWEGEKRRQSYEYVQNELDINGCRVNCRMDEVNRYLWRLQNPNAHDNFI